MIIAILYSARSEKLWKSLRAIVVLPVPTLPYITASPIRCRTAYWHFASASLCCELRKKERGSGDIENGASWRPKNDSYIRPVISQVTVSNIAAIVKMVYQLPGSPRGYHWISLKSGF